MESNIENDHHEFQGYQEIPQQNINNNMIEDPCADVLPWNLAPINNSINYSSIQLPVLNSSFQMFPHLPSSLQQLPFSDELYERRASANLQLGYEGSSLGSSSLSNSLELAGIYMRPESTLIRGRGSMITPSMIGGFHGELGKMTTAQEMMDAKALAASKSHSEAERRRRERINAHLAKLRSMLPSTIKTDKASLLAEVIQHVKELKRQTLEIAEESPLPTESDELIVDTDNDDDGRFLIRASMCCDDRSDLLPDLIKALKLMKLRALKANITTLGGRVKNVLVVTGEDGDNCEEHSVKSIHDKLKAVMERNLTSAADEPSSMASGSKRQRTINLSTIVENSTV